jgi:hypothetical protein
MAQKAVVVTDNMPDATDWFDLLNHQFLPLYGAAGEGLEFHDADVTVSGVLLDGVPERLTRLADEWVPKMRAFTAACTETTQADDGDDHPTRAEAP